MPRKNNHRTRQLTITGVEVRVQDGTLIGDIHLDIDLYGLARSVADKAMLSKSGKVRLRGGLIVVSAPHIKKV